MTKSDSLPLQKSTQAPASTQAPVSVSAPVTAAVLVGRCASRAQESRGRLYEESSRPTRDWRGAFERDRDRIIHAAAFRRLRHKTQVFIAPEGDHYRVRLTHSMEVAQIGRVIARALGLNEDLTEVLCLAHDIGHPPFGHAGEAALNIAMYDAGGFDHNGHALRILMKLEQAYPTFDGLNLSWEVLEGLAKHNGPIAQPGWALAEADALFPLELWSFASLEAQVAAVADDIAYDNHDIDDGLRAGILSADSLFAQPFATETYHRTKALYRQASQTQILREMIREQIGRMVSDVIAESERRILTAGVDSTREVRAAKTALIAFSESMCEKERQLKKFMYANLYRAPSQLAAATAAQHVVAGLFAAYVDGAPPFDKAKSKTPEQKSQNKRAIGDYIAGMTDIFALDRYADICGAVPTILRRATRVVT